MTATLDPLLLDFQLALAGRYSIDRELGRGGMGVVYMGALEDATDLSAAPQYDDVPPRATRYTRDSRTRSVPWKPSVSICSGRTPDRRPSPAFPRTSDFRERVRGSRAAHRRAAEVGAHSAFPETRRIHSGLARVILLLRSADMHGIDWALRLAPYRTILRLSPRELGRYIVGIDLLALRSHVLSRHGVLR